MTIAEAEQKGYNVVAASAFEVGLVFRGRGLRTWWAKDFDGKLPSLDHPKIQECIAINEEFFREYPEFFEAQS